MNFSDGMLNKYCGTHFEYLSLSHSGPQSSGRNSADLNLKCGKVWDYSMLTGFVTASHNYLNNTVATVIILRYKLLKMC